MNENFDVIIIGAGAAGMMAAISAANIRVEGRAARVLLLDGKEKIGAKILVSGGTRCNVTNEFVHPSRFHTESDPNRAMAFKGDGARSFVGRVLRAFSPESTLRFFENIGVELKLEESGKYFPVSNSSREVLNALRKEVCESGAEIQTGVLVENIAHEGDGWRITTAQGVLPARAVVIATGGLALPKSGSEGAGLKWAKNLGHTIISTTPALTPLLSDKDSHTHLSGVAVPVRLRFVGARQASPLQIRCRMTAHFSSRISAIQARSRSMFRVTSRVKMEAFQCGFFPKSKTAKKADSGKSSCAFMRRKLWRTR